MVATWNPAANAGYYTHQTGYYTGGAGVEPDGVWFAPGSDLGLVDGTTVNADVFERLFAGRSKDGRSLISNGGGRLDRVPAFDVTLSAPRSVSLAWALGDDDTRLVIEAAHQTAVRDTLELLEREAAFARRGQGGGRIERVPLSAALFRHGESRPAEHANGAIFADPNLHTHCVILNLATRADGTVGALHSTILRDWKMAAGATYHASLAAGLMKAGLSIDRLGKNGIFELAGIGDDAIHYFSARRNEIVEELADAGLTSDQAVGIAAMVAKITRAAKVADTVPREQAWREAAGRIGFEVDASITRDLKADTTQRDRDAHLAERLSAIPAQLTEIRSVVERRDVVRAVAEAFVGTGIGADHIDAEVERLIADGAVVELGRDRLGLPRYSTPEMIRLEREVFSIAVAMSEANDFAIDPERVMADCAQRGLNTEQSEAVERAISKGRLALIEGAPGTGKTTLLAPAVAAWKASGYRVVGAASAWKVANALRDDLSIEARATASWLAREKAGQSFLDAKSVLIVDEAGLLSSRDMHGLLDAASRSGAKVLLVGDRMQLQAIGAGSGLAIVARAIEVANVRTIVRQREAWARDAVTSFGKGEAEQALGAFVERGRLVEADGARAAIMAVAHHVDQRLGSTRANDFLIIAKTNAEVLALGAEVRRRMRERQMLTGTDINVDAASPSGHSVSLSLAQGDRIRFLARNDRIGVINGSVATVIGIEAHGGSREDSQSRHAVITAQIGETTIRFDTSELADDTGRARLGWAYASTIYGAQGATVEDAVVLLSPAFDRHDIYVAASRARGTTTLVVDRRRIDQEIRATGSEAVEIDEEARRKLLANRMSAAHIKETTLDYGTLERLEPQPRPERKRAWENDHAL
ncbi:MobF family relaxase [Shinella zoogloeoides]|uniref:Relaxase domain-containing protein n=1 Tax=Shinella zoogloeoides TaxID=352475 RepID=A0A6N8TJB7_SHIZO|nr:MobF family relaxase [Shinella zoogloeoides]MXO01190.1 relaxase domain-containing protein [Shinella zoogloeoides]UEX81809.1 relaxase domain-containing protein [Shinella zoogloeoides]